MRRRDLLQRGAAAMAALGAIRSAAAHALAPLAQGGWDALRDAYDLAPGVVYLNHASIGTTPRPLLNARQRYLEVCETNPWLYMWGGAWEEGRETARAAAARLLGCEAGEVAITHNTTEGFNLLAQGLPLQPGDEVLCSSLNHPGATVCWQQQARRRGFSQRTFEFPLLDAADLTAADIVDIYAAHVRDETRVLVFPHVDNIVGLRYPLAAMASMAHEAGVEWVAVDGAQTAAMLPLEIGGTGVDFYATSGHKWIQGPKGTGLLYLRDGQQAHLEPMWTTWGQARWSDSARRYEDYGTRNLAEVLTLGDAVAFQEQVGVARAGQRLQRLREYAHAAVAASAGLRWRSPRNWADGASLFAVELRGGDVGVANERLFQEHGIVVRPFGGELGTFRLSPNVITREAEIDRFIEAAEAL